MNNTIKKLLGLGAAGLLGAVVVIYGLFGWIYVAGGEYARIQKPNGSFEWHVTNGFKVKTPFLDRYEIFNQYNTIDMTDGENPTATIDLPLHKVNFNDTYTMDIGVTARYSLMPDPEKLETMYQANKTNKALVASTMVPNLRNLLSQTANQFRGEDYLQGGQNEFQARLYYQAENGLYVTERVKREIDVESGYSSSVDQANTSEGTKQTKALAWVVDLVRDAQGKPITQESQLAKFGVMLDLIEINKFIPDPDLEAFMTQKRAKIRERAGIVEDQRNAREAQVTARLMGEKERIEERNKALKIKDRAVITEAQQVEVEQERAKLEIVKKNKELQIAKANEDIQKATYEAAKYEALALKETGLAEAQVEEAKYKAKDRQLYMKELELENNKHLYNALPALKVQMPQYVQMGGNQGGMNSNLEAMSSLKLMEGLGMSTPATAAAK